MAFRRRRGFRKIIRKVKRFVGRRRSHRSRFMRRFIGRRM